MKTLKVAIAIEVVLIVLSTLVLCVYYSQQHTIQTMPIAPQEQKGSKPYTGIRINDNIMKIDLSEPNLTTGSRIKLDPKM
jgi:hypothetical protein